MDVSVIEEIGMAICGLILTTMWVVVCWLVGDEED